MGGFSHEGPDPRPGLTPAVQCPLAPSCLTVPWCPPVTCAQAEHGVPWGAGQWCCYCWGLHGWLRAKVIFPCLAPTLELGYGVARASGYFPAPEQGRAEPCSAGQPQLDPDPEPCPRAVEVLVGLADPPLVLTSRNPGLTLWWPRAPHCPVRLCPTLGASSSTFSPASGETSLPDWCLAAGAALLALMPTFQCWVRVCPALGVLPRVWAQTGMWTSCSGWQEGPLGLEPGVGEWEGGCATALDHPSGAGSFAVPAPICICAWSCGELGM